MVGNYEILRELGRGSMGTVYEGRDTRSNRRVAIKMLALSNALTGVDKRQALERFQREAKAAGSLVHPNIAQVYETAEFNVSHYMVMEYCGGATLRDMLRFEKRISEPKLRDIADQLLSALEVAHAANVIHRDIKPDNIIIGPDGKIKLMDFGIAKLVTAGTMTQTGQVMGSPAYMSPEQVLGKQIDGRSDLFSAGVVFYECLMGKKPFEADTVTAIAHQIVYTDPDPVSGVPSFWSAIIQKAMLKDPGQRYQSASEMRSDLKQQRSPVLPQPQPAVAPNQTTFSPAPVVMTPPPQPNTAPPGPFSTPNYGQYQQGPPQQMGVPGYGQQYPPPGGQYGASYQQNTSGMGSASFVPFEIRGGWNWGAFLLSLLWSIGNQVWIGLLCLVPYLGWVMCIILGFKGNEWAWQYRRWDSIEHFRETQRIWANWGLGIVIVSFLFWFLLVVLIGSIGVSP